LRENLWEERWETERDEGFWYAVTEGDPAALNFTKEYITNNVSMYRFLKAIPILFDISEEKVRNNINRWLQIVIDSAGLIY
jgi:hypothetical protein